MICPNCNSKENDNSEYCINCGYPLSGNEDQSGESGGNLKLDLQKANKWKFGWGWILVGVLIVILTEEYNIYFQLFSSLVQSISFCLFLVFYFLYRQKFLVNINNIWVRSFLSGIFSLAIIIPSLYLLSENIKHTIDDPVVVKTMYFKFNEMSEQLKTIHFKLDSLQAKIDKNGVTKEKIDKNIAMLDEQMILCKEQDSVFGSACKDILQSMEASNETVKSVPYIISDFSFMVDLCDSMNSGQQKYLHNLRLYYLSLSNEDKQERIYYDNYTSAYIEFKTFSDKFMNILNKYSGDNFGKIAPKWREILYRTPPGQASGKQSKSANKYNFK